MSGRRSDHYATDWARVDWKLTNKELAALLGVREETVSRFRTAAGARKSLGRPRALSKRAELALAVRKLGDELRYGQPAAETLVDVSVRLREFWPGAGVL